MHGSEHLVQLLYLWFMCFEILGICKLLKILILLFGISFLTCLVLILWIKLCLVVNALDLCIFGKHESLRVNLRTNVFPFGFLEFGFLNLCFGLHAGVWSTLYAFFAVDENISSQTSSRILCLAYYHWRCFSQ